jgi:hypothetical protein
MPKEKFEWQSYSEKPGRTSQKQLPYISKNKSISNLGDLSLSNSIEINAE